MSSQSTYSKLSVIHRSICEYWRDPSHSSAPDLSDWLAGITLRVARAALRGEKLPSATPPVERIERILASAARNTDGSSTAWFDYVEAALHMCERMLGAKLVQCGKHECSVEFEPARRRGRPCGAYGTPREIAQPMIMEVLAALGRSGTKNLLDLSTEAGQFPITVLATAPRRSHIRVFAVDRDRSALRLCRRLYSFASQHSPSDVALALTCRDSLFDPLPRHWPGVFDAVIGNPPWAARLGSYTERVRSAFSPFLTQNFDLYLAFVLRADALLRPGGILSMVVPSTFLFNDSGQPVRKYLLEHYDFLTLRVHPRGSITELRCVVPVSFVLRKRAIGSAAATSTRIMYGAPPARSTKRRSTSDQCDAAPYWRSLTGMPFHPLVRPDIQKALSHLGQLPRVRDFGTVRPGARLSTRNANEAEVAFTGYQARDLRPFHACERGSTRYTNERRFDRAPKERDISVRKVLFQDLRFVTHSRRLIAALGDPGTYPVSTASMFVPNDPNLADLWVAIFNSAIANTWYKLRDVSRVVKLELIRELPVPLTGESVAEVVSLSQRCADLRHQLHRRGDRCTVSNEHLVFAVDHPTLYSEISNAEHELDALLFELYRVPRKLRRTILDFSDARVF